MGKSMAGSLTAAVRRGGHGGQGCGDSGGHTAPALESLYQTRPATESELEAWSS